VGPPLAPTEVHLWLARPDRATDPALLSAYLALLSPDERSQHQRFAFAPRRHEHLVTRALVRTVLSRYGTLPPAAWRFARNPHGRPELDPPCGLLFNLSNAPGLVGCAVARGPVGVDLEPHHRGDTILELAARVLSAAERLALEGLPAALRPDRALSLWTLKEAYLKARGTGLTLPLQELEFNIAGPGAVTATFGPALGDRPERWAFGLLDHAGHRLAVGAARPARLSVYEVVPLSAGAEVPVAVVELAG
jgi:4'-phosphopantetheinyl transferase